METIFPGQGHDAVTQSCAAMTKAQIDEQLGSIKKTMIDQMGFTCPFEFCGQQISQGYFPKILCYA